MNKEKLKALLSRYHVPVHVLSHMVKVTSLAIFLGEKIKKNGKNVNINLTRQAGLLHDILKVGDFRNLDPAGFNQKVTKKDLQTWQSIIRKYHKQGHVEAGNQLLAGLGEEKIAAIIKKHRLGCVVAPNLNQRPVTIEEKLIYYADKRVTHDKIVTLKDRLVDLSQRYSKAQLDEQTEKMYKAIYRLEKEICNAAKVQPDKITDLTICNSVHFNQVVSYLS
jgi:putative nucleotidyltransferase with HDIG domain